MCVPYEILITAGALTVPFVSREANRLKAGTSLCPVLTGSEEFNLGGFYRKDRCNRHSVFILIFFAVHPFLLIYCDIYTVGKSTVVYF